MARRIPRTPPTWCTSFTWRKTPRIFRVEDGILADVAPTLLFLLGLSQPPEMTGRNLLVRAR
jgi:bisphosphoglycerate-independent phosphoglycerate mutase (AlkP superfamily)